MDFVHAIEKALNKKGKIIFKPMQPGDVKSTYANVESLFNYINFKPSTNLEEGVKAFVNNYLKLNT
jgi:UDP-glucuronate 4-epimerase